MLRGIVYLSISLFIFCSNIVNAESQRVNLIIASDPVVAPEGIMGRLIRRLEMESGLSTLYYRVDSVEGLIQALNQPDFFEIQSVYFLGIHGYRFEQTMGFAVVDEVGGQPTFVMDDLKGRVQLNFSENALVVLDSCEIMPKDGGVEAAQSFKEIASALGMKSGSIYGNYTVGSNATEVILGTPFYESNRPNESLSKLAAQAIWPISFIYYYYKDRSENNRGYIYTFESESGFYSLQPKKYYRIKGQTSLF